MNTPLEITLPEWQEIRTLLAVKELWGLTTESAEEFASTVYGVKFNFESGGPGYVGDLYILQGNALTGNPPLVIRRVNGSLEPS